VLLGCHLTPAGSTKPPPGEVSDEANIFNTFSDFLNIGLMQWSVPVQYQLRMGAKVFLNFVHNGVSGRPSDVLVTFFLWILWCTKWKLDFPNWREFRYVANPRTIGIVARNRFARCLHLYQTYQKFYFLLYFVRTCYGCFIKRYHGTFWYFS
jgi:hypothetical protein